MLTIAICDDNPVHLERTASLVRRETDASHTEIDCFSGWDSLQKVLASGDYKPDIAILDVVLEKQNPKAGADRTGIDLARELNRMLPECRIIFLSGYPEYISASYEAKHVWFVLKSQAETYLGPALKKALSSSAATAGVPGIAVRNGKRSFFLPLEDILYIDRDGRKTRVVCKEESHLVSGTPASLISGAVRDSFVRCHQSYWVNLTAVRELDHEEFILHNGTRIPIGRTYRQDARERFFRRYRAV